MAPAELFLRGSNRLYNPQLRASDSTLGCSFFHIQSWLLLSLNSSLFSRFKGVTRFEVMPAAPRVPNRSPVQFMLDTSLPLFQDEVGSSGPKQWSHSDYRLVLISGSCLVDKCLDQSNCLKGKLRVFLFWSIICGGRSCCCCGCWAQSYVRG